MSLTIEQIHYSPGMNTQRVGGFEEGELRKLKDMPHGKARDELIRMLNERNGGLGPTWECGYGMYGLWFDNEYAYVNIGSSCD